MAHHQRGRTHRFSRVAVRLSFSTPGALREKVSAEGTLSCAPHKQRPENAKASPTCPQSSINRQEPAILVGFFFFFLFFFCVPATFASHQVCFQTGWISEIILAGETTCRTSRDGFSRRGSYTFRSVGSFFLYMKMSPTQI